MARASKGADGRIMAAGTDRIARGTLVARFAQDPADLDTCLRLRGCHFRADRDWGDAFDGTCRHMMIEDAANGALKGTARLMILRDGRDIHRSYSAQWYDLACLSRIAGPMMEIGRLCTRDPGDPDPLRLGWAFIAHVIETRRIAFLLGCASFPGTDPARHVPAFARLARYHLAPPRWRPGVKDRRALSLVPFAGREMGSPDGIPPLLAAYLRMGGHVGGHAVIDPDMETIHVFVGVETARLSPAGRHRLRALAEDGPSRGPR